MALRIVSHTPNINATGVYRNEDIKITFDKSIRPSTVDYTTYSVNDHSTFTSVPGTYSMEYNASGSGLTAVFTPSINMTANTKYDVFVYGSPDSILSLNNESLDQTYTFTFTTGTEVYDSSTGSGALPSGEATSTFSGTLNQIPPSATGSISAFEVYTTTPKNQTPHITINTSGIDIVFTGVIETSLSDISGYLTVEEDPVLE